jgi:hypothetical protein
MNHPTLRCLAWLPVLLALFVAAGCGTAEYERRMQARLVELRHQAKFRSLNDVPSELLEGSTELTIRLPIKAGVPMTTATPDQNDTSKPMDARRLQPPFLPLPGFKLCFEQMIEAKGQQLPYTMYIAAEKLPPLPEGAEKRDPVESTLVNQLQTAFPDGDFKWTDVQCSSPDPTSTPLPGVPPTFGTVLWRSLEVSNDQEFFSIPDGGVQTYVTLPGTLKLFLYEHKENGDTRYFVLLGWRVPKTVLEEQKIPPNETMDSLMNLIGGTIKVHPQTPAAPQ